MSSMVVDMGRSALALEIRARHHSRSGGCSSRQAVKQPVFFDSKSILDHGWSVK